MSGKPKPEALLGLSASEAKTLLLASFLSSDQKVDYEKLAQLGGYKTAASASTLYHKSKRKLADCIPANIAKGGAATNTNTPDATPSATPKKSPSKRKTPAKDGEENGNGDGGESPAKLKKQRTPAKEVKVEAVKDESESDESGMPSARPLKMEDELFPNVRLEDTA